MTSPEFQAAVKRGQAEETARRAAELQESIADQEKADRTVNTIMAFFWLLTLAVVLGLIYALIKFVKWAWYN